MNHQDGIEKETNAAATVSILIGILGFFFSLIPIVGWVLAPLWVIAILFGMVGLLKEYNRRVAIIGIATGIFTFLYKITMLQFLGIY